MQKYSRSIQDPDGSGDPRVSEPKPQYPQDKLDYPGQEADMRPKADHGEEFYQVWAA